MSIEIPPRKTLSIIGMVGAISILLVLVICFSGFWISSSYAQSVVDANKNLNGSGRNLSLKGIASSSLPIVIKIPKINVRATLEGVGLTSQGEVGVPKGQTNAAWFNLGPRPGDVGNAIITGHYGRWKNGTQTVFNNLGKLKKGDRLYVQDNKGKTTTFVVSKLQIYNQNDDVSNVFISNDDKAHLNLITCAGPWNVLTKSYLKRLVVFADKE